MANVLGELFQDIADAIRSKTGSTDTLKPNEFPAAIEGITAGGGEGEKPFDCHSVTFVYDDKSYVRSVADGDTCADPVERGLIPTPTKESTAQYNYTFYGWGASDGGAADANILKNITEDKTVYAIFTATARLYTITWLDEDGTELPGQKQWPYGTVPSYTPTKDGYAFDKWTPTPTAVTGNASYTASWTSSIASGTWGNNITWKLTANWTLTLSGTGAVRATSSSSNWLFPWSEYNAFVTKIVIEEGITSLPSDRFLGSDNTSLTTVELPETLTSLGQAFSLCKSLSNINFPSGITSIPDYAFNGSFSGTLTIPSHITSIGKEAFSYSRITRLEILGVLQTIGGSAFQGCSSLEKISIAEGNTFIGVNMFSNCKALTTVELPETLTSISDFCFQSCYALSSVAIPDNVTSIGTYAFRLCSLKSVIIPDSVVLIKTYAFNKNTSLTNVTFENTSGWWVTTDSAATSGTAVDVANSTTAATLLGTTYAGYYWNRTSA